MERSLINRKYYESWLGPRTLRETRDYVCQVKRSSDAPRTLDDCLQQGVCCPACDDQQTRGTYLLGGGKVLCKCGKVLKWVCPWVGCRYHLSLEVRRTGGYVLRHDPLRLDDAPYTCVFDVVMGKGPCTLDVIGDVLGFTREMVRIIQTRALDKVEKAFVLEYGMPFATEPYQNKAMDDFLKYLEDR